MSQPSSTDRLANNALRLGIYSLVAWPVIWAGIAKWDYENWGLVYGFVVGLLVAIAGSAIGAIMGLKAMNSGTRYRIRAATPITITFLLIIFVLLVYGELI